MTIFEIELFGLTISPSYYGLMYALGFISGYWIIKNKIFVNNKNILKPDTKWKIGDFMDSLLFYIFFGVVIGGRLGYVIFYNFSNFIQNPIDIIKIWEGGMSFHGGLIGVAIAMWLFSKKHKISFLALSDQISLVVPIGIGLGRIGNYLNKELLGYPDYYGPLAIKTNTGSYFPSPLVEFFLEGILLFLILNIVYIKKTQSKKKSSYSKGQIASLFLILYGTFRIFVEAFFREPDAHIGYILNYFTLGEIYSLPMVIIGIYFYIKLAKQKK